MSATDELDAMLAGLAQQAQRCRDFQCRHGLERHASRKTAKKTISMINLWRKEAAAGAPTLLNSRCTATAPGRDGSADSSIHRPPTNGSNECQQAPS
jgi:hypothetical protein